MKVVHLVSGLRGGGAEKMILQFCRLSRNDSAVQMSVAVLGEADELAGEFAAEQIEVFQPAVKGGSLSKTFYGRVSSTLQCIRYCITKKPAIIHAHMYHAAMAAVVIKLFFPRVKVVFSLHNSRQPGIHRRFFLWCTRVFRDLDLVFPGQKNAWFQKRHVYVVRNGIDLSKFSPSNQKYPVFTFLFAGRFEKQKRPGAVLDLARSLKGKSNFRVLMVGEGKERPRLEGVIRDWGLGDVCELLHFQSDMATVMSRSHCLLLPSIYEGLPLVVLEAGACAVPVLATPGANSCGMLTNSNSFVVDIQQFSATAKAIVDNYAEALNRSGRLQGLVRKSFSVEAAYSELIESYRVVHDRPN